MCGSMVDIQSPTAEMRGKKERRKKIEITGQKYNALLHRATIITILAKLLNRDIEHIGNIHKEKLLQPITAYVELRDILT